MATGPMLARTPDGVSVVVHEWGDPQGPEVLLIHGVAQSHLCFARELAYNMLAPIEVRSAIRSWPTDLAATTAALRATRVPTLITHGRRDLVVLPEAAEAAAAIIPDAHLSW